MLRLYALLAAFQSGRATKTTQVTEMEPVKMAHIDDEAKLKVCTDLHDYDVAFRDEEPIKIEEYEEGIPDMLFPISITWTDESNKVCTNIIAMDMEAKRQKWMKL